MAFSLQTHVRNGEKIVRVRPYVRLSRGSGEPVLYLQDGGVYTESGARADPLPPWFAEELKKVDSKVLQAVGFDNWDKPKRGRPKGSGKKDKEGEPSATASSEGQKPQGSEGVNGNPS